MNHNKLTFSDFSFSNLSIDQWYEVVRLRELVFIVEQHCIYVDADGKDQCARHILGQDDQGSLKAYARIVHPDDQFSDPRSVPGIIDHNLEVDQFVQGSPGIGRVVLDPEYRGMGLGDQLMQYTMNCCHKLYPGRSIFISAQEPLQAFYESFNFKKCGNSYLEDGIPHIPMLNSVHL